MKRSLYLSALLNLSKIHDALTISLPFSTSQSLHIDDALTISLCTIQDSETIKSMTRTIYLLENIKAACISQSLQFYDALNISVGPLFSDHSHLQITKIHDALYRNHYSQTILILKSLKSMTRSLYLLENNIIAAFSRFSQSFQIHDVLNISIAEHYSSIFKALSKLSNLWHTQNICCSTTLEQIHDALYINHYFQTILILKSLKSMTRSLCLLDNNIIIAFPRFSQSFQPHDALNIPLAEQHYSCILKALSKLSSPWHPQYFCCNTTL